MPRDDQNGSARRQAVAHRLETFFQHWLDELESDAARIWHAVEQRLAEAAQVQQQPAPQPQGKLGDKTS
jgi:hypothetical protein